MELALIDNESKARSILRAFILESREEITIVGEADSVASGVELINTLKPEAILLDVEMEDGTGFDLLQQLDAVKPHVIFVTAFDHYAIQAFRADAVDYLEKPVLPKLLVKGLQKLKKQMSLDQAPIYPTTVPVVLQSIKERIAVPTRYGTLYVKAEEILYVKAVGAYSEFYMEKGQQPHLVSRRMHQVVEALEHLGFVRVHRSFVVNVVKVRELSKTDGGFVILENGTQVPFSKHYKSNAFQMIRALTTNL